MDHFNKFLSTSPEKRLKEYRTKGDSYWKKTGEDLALKLFHEAAERVPAYKDFLKQHNIKHSQIISIDDYKKIPLTDKPNYINKYRLNELCWDGKLEASYFMSSSSGSTGIPNYWPRSPEQTAQGAAISELIYKDIMEADKKSTLYIVCFAMGMWIAGTYMMTSTEWVAQKGYPITVVTPGMNREEILRLVQLGHEHYDQIIMVGYPPFVKDIIDKGIEESIPWEKINIKFLFTGEAFTERWRDHLEKKTGLKNIFTDCINIYGSADVGLVAHETPYTIFLRKASFKNEKILKELFNAERIPSVNQYDPRIRYFEQVNDELIITSRSGLPLIRYNTKDVGNILYYEDARQKLLKHGADVEKEFEQGAKSRPLWKTPSVYLFGRGKFAASIYGITIFPEFVKYVLDSNRITEFVTGKYVVSTEETLDHDQELNLRVELREGLSESNQLAALTRQVFVDELPMISSEYKHLLSSMGEKVYPKVILHKYGDQEYFPRGVVKKNA